ncbi:HEAT repeat protein [Poriferisphaera corsica]|uniref:HEAT repeat protein n=1 Tax=Poriferisphaera corsica TaxID=2528020 RepID=A0A517YSJ7_9BACT|nr:HEAT repeat domain-containing protein [Poriferisphaera corsica]QDU33209.1 HEAT repeat protein [Poriferisphaera corsica]
MKGMNDMGLNVRNVSAHLVMAGAVFMGGEGVVMGQALEEAVSGKPAAEIAETAAEQTLSVDEIYMGGRARAVEVVLNASRSASPFFRANAMEAAAYTGDRALPLLQLGLDDRSEVVRFAALVSIGKLADPALGKSAAAYVNDSDPSVRAAAIFAAKKCGAEVNESYLAELLNSKDARQRRNAASVLGWLGNKSAVPMLREGSWKGRMRNPNEYEIDQIAFAEAIARLGEETALDVIRGKLYTGGAPDETRVYAVTVLGDLGDAKMARVFENMLNDTNMQVRIAAATTLTKLGYGVGGTVLLDASHYDGERVEMDIKSYLSQHKNREDNETYRRLLASDKALAELAGQIRGQAAFGLAMVGNAGAAQRVVAMLDDEMEQARLSAAAAMLKALTGQGVK